MSSHEILRFEITSASPLLMHNGVLADPLNPHSKSIAALAKRRVKTDADHSRIARLEFMGGLYLNGGVPCIPAEMIEAALVKAASQARRGGQARAGILVQGHPRLQYDGPKEPEALWEDKRFRLRTGVRLGQRRIVRTRPRFETWSAEVAVGYLPGLLNPGEVHGFFVTAGEQIGIGDWRPKFGRFSVAEITRPQVGLSA